MKRILYIGGFELPDRNAAAQRVLANAELLRDMGYEVFFIGVSKDIGNAPSRVSGFESSPVKYPITVRQWIHQVITFVDFDKIKEYKPNYVVLYNFPSIASLRILRRCHKSNIKVIHDLTEWEESGGWNPRDFIRRIDINFRMRYCMKKMDGVIAISRYLYEYYKRYTECILVPPTVDLNNSKFERERNLDKKEDEIKLIYAGYSGSGRAKDRLDIITDAISRHPNFRLDIIGMDETQYKGIYGTSSIMSGNIFFHGWVSHQDAVKAVCDADFQVLIREDTLKNRAGFPSKFVESISCCTPVIATKTSNICDYLEDGKNGYIVTDERPLDLVLDTISGLSSSEISKMKMNCKELRVFDYKNYQNEFSTLFN